MPELEKPLDRRRLRAGIDGDVPGVERERFAVNDVRDVEERAHHVEGEQDPQDPCGSRTHRRLGPITRAPENRYKGPCTIVLAVPGWSSRRSTKLRRSTTWCARSRTMGGKQ